MRRIDDVAPSRCPRSHGQPALVAVITEQRWDRRVRPGPVPALVLPMAVLVAPIGTSMFHAMTLRGAWIPVPVVALSVAAALPGLTRLGRPGGADERANVKA